MIEYQLANYIEAVAKQLVVKAFMLSSIVSKKGDCSNYADKHDKHW